MFVKFLAESIARKVELRDEALERAESRDDAAKMAADISAARTAHNKARTLSTLDGEKLSAAGFAPIVAVGEWNKHKGYKMKGLAESLASGKLTGTHNRALVPLLVAAAKGEGYLSRASLEAEGKYKDAYRSYWRPFVEQGAIVKDDPGGRVLGYFIVKDHPIIADILRVFG